jgi:hypothetical protein
MGYPNFQHHPDGWIIIRTNAGVYMDTIANFQTDFGSSYPELPDGYIGRYYEPGVSHYLHTSDTAVPQDLIWMEGDAYIAAYDALAAAKAVREAAARNTDGTIAS